ncbi:MAG: ABC transporter ATP-binding protein [Cryomorphaceae bacterium]|jgi:ABC-2 type transport system ATP-binding protein|nr:ABC transporter ATP-binding protein [Cryomorphaceae bacterium]MBT3688960.1 ABC transporter ATP-binding protein [Cryomorphaceae bacterium]MBT4221628.1 ABC transporter ATP-binding protein [Cryomorphaceae bacterium]MBT4292964.1 ABC transporter ATP-binding protein [Cryomorphaceae bacterium]MBT4517381.1 ABC transporter ATP-binding protein [Cryomorphaceae bacterium]|tara:strand:- start:2902 stop:3828 length:927 start_codon:yes stop_codon:yes gene_type:complete
MNNILSIDSVSKHYGEFTALNNVSMNIREGSIFGLLGPNGAGKTTLIRIINQITSPDTGKVLFNNTPLELKHIKDIGYLPEERGLYPKMAIGDQAVYLAQLKGLDRATAKSELNKWFEKFEIKDWWDKKVTELSKGMAQKIQFIVTVLHKPKLLIFDEPFSGFDPINANLIKDEILLLREEGATVIFSTHRMESVEELCEDIALINKSNKILDGNLDDIKKKYKSNTFEIAVDSKDPISLSKKLESIYDVSNPSFKTIGDNLKLNVKLKNNQNSEDLLKLLNQNTKVIHFKEVIPSVNDIFINSVKND